MSNKFISEKNKKKWMQKKHKTIRNNSILMKRLRDMFSEIDQSTIFSKENIVECKKILSQMLIKWVKIQIDQQQLSNTKNNNKHQQQQQQQQSLSLSTILQYEYSIKCQITGRIPSQPSRTSQCKFLCVVDHCILQETGICSCGREVQKYQNQIVNDWLLQMVVKFNKLMMQNYNKGRQNNSSKQVKKWKGLIRIDLLHNDFEFVYQ